MKILFLSSLYPPKTRGGGEISTHLIAQGLSGRGHDVRVITTGHKREVTTLDGVTVVRLPVPLTAKPLFERRHSKKIAKILVKEIGDLKQYDVIHCHDFRTALAVSELQSVFALRQAQGSASLVVTARDYAQICGTTNAILWDGSRCTCSWHDVLLNHRVVEAPWWRKPFRIWQYKYNIQYRKEAFRRFPAQIFISHAQLKEVAVQQDLEGVRTKVIYNPVPREYLTTPMKESVHGNVLYVGTVESYKGVGLLLEAWRKIVRQLPHVHLKIVGDGAQRDLYEQHIERWGLNYRVTFSGRVPWDRLSWVYDEATVVVAPSLWVEPFGRTVAEAMARGRLVVAANVGGPAELIKDRITGLLFKRGQVDDLARCLFDALTMSKLDKLEIQRSARAWVRDNLTMAVIAQQHEEFYMQIQKSPYQNL
jgi:glycosyltransferase involved in cell wall biosynthesis